MAGLQGVRVTRLSKLGWIIRECGMEGQKQHPTAARSKQRWMPARNKGQQHVVLDGHKQQWP